MCSHEHLSEAEDPAQLMPRVVAAAWALLATRPPSLSSHRHTDGAVGEREEDEDV